MALSLPYMLPFCILKLLPPLFLFVFELDGFLCVAFGIFYLDCYRVVVTLCLDAECRFFKKLSVLIFQAPVIIPINAAWVFIVNVLWGYRTGILLTVLINPHSPDIKTLRVNVSALFINYIQIEIMFFIFDCIQYHNIFTQ